MNEQVSKSTVYFDGSCSLCRMEIEYYRRKDVDYALCFIDVSQPDTQLHDDLTPTQAMRRFHVRNTDGELVSGAVAFATIWAQLPTWHWVARAAALPGAISALEFGYIKFLRLRPLISRLVRKFQGGSFS